MSELTIKYLVVLTLNETSTVRSVVQQQFEKEEEGKKGHQKSFFIGPILKKRNK